MKIVGIQIENILGLQRAEIIGRQPITLIAGGNEAGKSSLCDAISMALTGKPRRVALKKDLGQLVHDSNGAKKGRVTIIGPGGEVLGQYRLPKGEHEIGASLEKSPGYEFLPLVLDAEAFDNMTADERRKTLFKLTGCKASPEDITAELKAAGCDMALVEQIIAIARSGFPAMTEEAKQRASQAKGDWKAVTGEVWGSEKAKDWEFETPTGAKVTHEQIEQAAAECHKIQHDIENGMAHKGKLEQQAADADRYAANIAELRDQAGMLSRATAKRDATQKDLDAWEAKLATVKAAMAGDDTYDCPCCDADLELIDGKLHKYAGALTADSKRDMLKDQAEASESVALLRRTLANDNQAIAAAQAAQTNLDAAMANKPEADEKALAKTIDAIYALRIALSTAQAKRDALTERYNLIAVAKETNEKATAAHKSISAWLAIAEQLAPAGIPATLLNKALAPVNTALEMLAGLSGWSVPAISESMEITYGGRAFELCSESARWRCNTMLALVIAQLSGLKFAVLDRLDVLELKGRPQLCAMVSKLVDIGNLDSLVMCGTMKAKPAMPYGFQSLWIENGVVLSEG
ncbi:MAG: AAA family ATPase [Pseudomonas sp.]